VAVCEELSVFGVLFLVWRGKWDEFGCLGLLLLHVNLVRDKEGD